ncbi:carbohydrate porin [Komarekiella sp. 'clone 1']|uniref:Carbohydrate porin n=1 Tax=Komarekiella delphini-convector SJRDD-AB1 TaxID=2593771 RepID=A0AA40VR14_9NOST|nr:iron uptake porin [Komarekiella delphini-convector]MBD6616367.1 carbohydrate porin [Komarekiella delphini-convector SJRDD-AB1]
MSIFSANLLYTYTAIFSFIVVFANSVLASEAQQDRTFTQLELEEQTEIPTTSVSELSDVQSTDWAFQELQSLVQRYGCTAGYPKNAYATHYRFTRYEFATALNACLDEVNQLIENQATLLTSIELSTIRRLKDEFAVELITLQNRLDNLEAQSAEITANQFSTTTQLNVSVVLAASDAIGDSADNNPNTTIDSNLAFNYRARINLLTSFTGRDRLIVRLQASNRVPNFNGVTGTNMTRQSFEVGNTDNNLALNLLEYRFPAGENFQVYLYANAASHHYYATVINPYFASFGGAKGSPSRFLERNPIYRIGNTTGSGLAAVYKPNESLRLDLGYLAQNANIATGAAGLFNGTYSGLVQLSYKPFSNAELGLLYVRNYSDNGDLAHRTGSTFSNLPFGLGVPLVSNSYAISGLWKIFPQLAVSGWFGYTNAERVDGVQGNADIINYAVNFAFPDLFKKSAIGGLGFGMPPKVIHNAIAAREDTGTGLHFEAFYEYPLNNNIKLIPGAIFIANSNHNDANGDIFVGTMRMVLSF